MHAAVVIRNSASRNATLRLLTHNGSLKMTRMHQLLLAETEQQIGVFRQMNDALLWIDADG